MDFGLSDEHRAIVATVRDFVRRELVPHEDPVEQLDDVPAELEVRHHVAVLVTKEFDFLHAEHSSRRLLLFFTDRNQLGVLLLRVLTTL